MPGILCRSHAATAVCVPSDARSVIVPRRADRTISGETTRLVDVKYTRLPRTGGSGGAAGRHHRAVTLPMVMKREKNRELKKAAAAALAEPAQARPTNDHAIQVVVMRVSIHCQGCAGKVKKHISKMEGVTSFSIDLESKRVTVTGHISPVGVLESISKVKKAEFWPC